MVTDFELERHKDINDIEGFLIDMTHSYSFNEIAQKLSHIKDLPKVLNYLCSLEYVENTDNKFRLTFRGANDYNNNTYLE